ncbi:hypothetical protein ATY78_01290 [Rhizobium sp. R635]|uniref:DUF262 domain-containing protein n=1 Tax=Rhizobium sp. R635 TaxID=1764275 RepID=UPI000B537289|nr:DUF262 domain-containing protein [Rhizobium sp. R635]OWV92202.1 hypothetical protein ATY78_01290 [Rhizobium sp. R635]
MPHQSAAIELRPIVQLLTDENREQARYFIPSYQRGYRWNQIQVRQLLNDIWDFVQASDGRPRSSFYCLQPLVVKKLPDGSYEVVDGQQRLTTIHIILSRLGSMMAMLEKTSFQIKYETRDDAFLGDIDLERSDENIDFHHMADAWRAVDEWVNQHGAPRALKLLQHLLADEEIGHNVKVIWYELTSQDDAVAAFTRLNIGKIPLTESELIRALFLRKAGKEGTAAQLHIAYQWDRIEHRLQDDAFWYFLQNSGAQTNRIGLLFDLVAQTWEDKANDDHAAFSYFSAALGERGADAVWKEVNNTFLALEEWFEDRHLYHVIGFLLHHSDRSEREIGSLLQESRKISKQAFQARLRQRIFSSLFGTPKQADGETITDWVRDQCAAVQYRHAVKVRKLLLFFNIATLLENDKSNIRFQFDSFKKHSWDMEHIRSVSDERPNSTGDRASWLKECRAFLATATDEKAPQLIKQIDKYLQSKTIGPDDGAFEKIDGKLLVYFGEAGEGGGNALSNLTLLDSRTNRGYKNAVFAVKRKILLENDQAGTFVPLCTRNVFLKCYSDTVANVTFWRDEDANDYFSAIWKTLTSFLVPAEAV